MSKIKLKNDKIDETKIITAARKKVVQDNESRATCRSYVADIQNAKAIELGFASMQEANGWAVKSPQAKALQDWGWSCRLKGLEIEDAVAGGRRPMVTREEMLAEMPVFPGQV
ncbi:MAG: hypothetical protein PHZ02_07325 [Desulfocapsaceae bacterium]|nr:hypothetical protein [Desulfocapsaceae bacterium]